MPTSQSIIQFWDAAAERNPYWYVSSYGPFDADRNLDEFWRSGQTIWADICRVSGYFPSRDHTVVEIGCGVGRLTRVIAPQVRRVFALDISPKMLEIAQTTCLANAEFMPATGFTLEGIPDCSADLALGYCVFQHLPDYGALRCYLAEMRRVVRPGGMIAFTLPPRDWTARLIPLLRLRAYLRQCLTSHAAQEVHRKEWVGIRPSAATVDQLSPVVLRREPLDAGRILHVARR